MTFILKFAPHDVTKSPCNIPIQVQITGPQSMTESLIDVTINNLTIWQVSVESDGSWQYHLRTNWSKWHQVVKFPCKNLTSLVNPFLEIKEYSKHTLCQCTAYWHWETTINLNTLPFWQIWPYSSIILCMCPANERWCYSVTPTLIGWAHTQNDPCIQSNLRMIHSFFLKNTHERHPIIIC